MSRIGTVLATVAGCCAVLAMTIVGIAYAGLVNVAATHEGNAGVHWFLQTTRESWIHARADEIEVPAFDDAARQAGLRHYQQMCVPCHGAPGVAASSVGKGLNPSPPELWRERHEPGEDFWILKHGIRMTGMPAFGSTHGDKELWQIVAFLQELPDVQPQEYARRTGQAGQTAPTKHRHDQDGHHSERHRAPSSRAGDHPADGSER